MKHEKALAYAAFAVVCIVWGTTYLAIRIAIETIPPLMLTCMRFVVAGVFMLGIAAWRGEKIPRDFRTVADLALVGFLMVGLGNLAVVWAEQWVPSGMAALFVATAPFWMVVIEAFRRNGERIVLRSGIGMLLGFIGVGLLVTPKGAGGAFDTNFILGAVAIQLGGIAWQLGSVRGKYTLKHVPLLASSGLQMLSGGIIVAIAGLAIGEHHQLSFNARTLAAYIYLTLFGSILAYSAYVYALAKLRTTQTSLYAYVNPVVAVILGWLILDEQLTSVSIAAMVVILVGVAMVQTASRPKQPLGIATAPLPARRETAAG